MLMFCLVANPRAERKESKGNEEEKDESIEGVAGQCWIKITDEQ